MPTMMMMIVVVENASVRWTFECTFARVCKSTETVHVFLEGILSRKCIKGGEALLIFFVTRK